MRIHSGKFLLLSLLLATALGGCGQKGPLVAPPRAPAEVPAPQAAEEVSPPVADEPATPTNDDDGALNNE